MTMHEDLTFEAPLCNDSQRENTQDVGWCRLPASKYQHEWGEKHLMDGRCRDTSWRRQDTGWVCFARSLRTKGNVARSLGWRPVKGEKEDWKEFLAEEVTCKGWVSRAVQEIQVGCQHPITIHDREPTSPLPLPL